MGRHLAQSNVVDVNRPAERLSCSIEKCRGGQHQTDVPNMDLAGSTYRAANRCFKSGWTVSLSICQRGKAEVLEGRKGPAVVRDVIDEDEKKSEVSEEIDAFLPPAVYVESHRDARPPLLRAPRPRR